MKLFSYIVATDSGFAPNPYWGFCTLATCKPKIRRYSNVGDWVAGLSSKSKGNKLVFAMRIKEIMTFAEYFEDNRFQKKIPDLKNEDHRYHSGDNIYMPYKNGYKQLPSIHIEKDKQRDLSVDRVLVSDEYYYFGEYAEQIPNDLQLLITPRGDKWNFDEQIVRDFIKYIKTQKRGKNGEPADIRNCSGCEKRGKPC